MELKAGESQLFKIHMPSSSELGGLEEDRVTSLTILAAPLIQAAYDSSNDFSLSANAKNGVTPGTNSVRSVQGRPVWASGKAIHLAEDASLAYSIDNQWCTDCYVNILLSVVAEGRYTIISKANTGQAQRIYENKPLFGVAKAGEKVCYKYHVKDGEANLDVRFKLYSGASSQTIDAVDVPETWDASEFKLTGAFDSEYVLTPRMRRQSQRGNHATGLYYICDFAHTYSSFSVLVKEIPTDQKHTLLENGFVYAEEIENYQTSMTAQHFLYQVPKLDFALEDIKLWFDLEVLSGPVPKMAIRYCNSF
jgi:hypothetical protein